MYATASSSSSSATTGSSAAVSSTAGSAAGGGATGGSETAGAWAAREPDSRAAATISATSAALIVEVSRESALRRSSMRWARILRRRSSCQRVRKRAKARRAKNAAARNAMIASMFTCSTCHVSVNVRSPGPPAEAATADRPLGTFSRSRETLPVPLSCLNHMGDFAS